MNLKRFRFHLKFSIPPEELIIYSNKEADLVYACEICHLPVAYIEDGKILDGVPEQLQLLTNQILFDSFTDTWLEKINNHWGCRGCGLVFSPETSYPAIPVLYTDITTLSECERLFKEYTSN